MWWDGVWQILPNMEKFEGLTELFPNMSDKSLCFKFVHVFPIPGQTPRRGKDGELRRTASRTLIEYHDTNRCDLKFQLMTWRGTSVHPAEHGEIRWPHGTLPAAWRGVMRKSMRVD